MGNSIKRKENSKPAATTSSLRTAISGVGLSGTSSGSQVDAPPAIVKGCCPSCQYNVYETNERFKEEDTVFTTIKNVTTCVVLYARKKFTKPIKESEKMVFIIIKNVSNIMTVTLIINVLYAWTEPMIFLYRRLLLSSKLLDIPIR